jgi:hypothetical protein
MMRVICCICHMEVGRKKGGEGDSHTICPVCMPSYLRAQGESPEEIEEYMIKHYKN